MKFYKKEEFNERWDKSNYCVSGYVLPQTKRVSLEISNVLLNKESIHFGSWKTIRWLRDQLTELLEKEGDSESEEG
jgi:hypothetical protein